MSDKATTLRLRRIRFKAGGEIRVIRPVVDTEAKDRLRRAAENICTGDMADSMAGFALVAWSKDGYVALDFVNTKSSPVPGGAVARYVGDVLAAEQAVRWVP